MAAKQQQQQLSSFSKSNASTLSGARSGPTSSLSSQEMRMLVDIQNRNRGGNGDPGLRTGKISLSELMGAGDKERKGHGSPPPIPQENLPPRPNDRMSPLSARQSPPMMPPPAPSGFPPLPPFPAHLHALRGGFVPNFPTLPFIPPQLLAAAMAAAAAAQASSGHAPMPPPLLPPHLLSLLPPLTPMYPLTPGTSGSGPASGALPGSGPQPPSSLSKLLANVPSASGSMRQQTPGPIPLNRAVGNPRNVPATTATAVHNRYQPDHQQAPGCAPIQKARKPFFMPYLNNDAVTRGLKNGDLMQGILRVNQRNYEESYVDNPEGDDQVDILILGIHDRNRALHGDVVVVRIKERSSWIVRDAMYEAWRTGHLNMSRDEDGQPLSIPPVAANENPNVPHGNGATPDHFFEPHLLTVMTSVKKWKRKVKIPATGCYERDDLLRIGAQMDKALASVLQRRHASTTSETAASTKGECAQAGSSIGLDATVEEAINRLAIGNRQYRRHSSPNAGGDSHRTSPPMARAGSNRRASGFQSTPSRRLNYRVLADMPDEDWGIPDVCLQKTAEVVFIAEQKNCRAAVGQLKMMSDGNRNWALFSPGDSRMPRMMIPADQLPGGFFDRPQDYAKFIFVARIVEWQATAQFARGKLYKSLGLAGDIEAETEGLLLANDIDTREFSQGAISSLPVSDSAAWKIDEREFKYRRDFRDEVVFTIDPFTARDLDDALHVRRLSDDSGWEVGVHIADVSHFVIPGTELDGWAANRATSTYLVIPMLPRILCEELCSLNSGIDRLTFSVVWKMNDEAEILEEWFGRSIIRSACKMAYEHAQDMIEHPDKNFEPNELPTIFDSHTPADIKKSVLQLHRLAQVLNARRLSNGALRLEQPKLKFCLNEQTQMPEAVSIYQRKEANSLVEEFMLLANMAVARHIESAYPKTALLRRHPPPKQKVLREVLEQCEKMGFPIHGTSSEALAAALRRYEGDSELQMAVGEVLSHLLLKPMQLAVYFCTGSMDCQADYRHFALNVPFYTHFTSPIRRYPDIMVHRLLSASLGYTPPPQMSIKQIEKQAERCNEKKLAAKTVSEASEDMFFGVFVKECGQLNERGVVIQVLDAAFDVLIVRFGVVKRVYVNRLRMARDPIFEEGPPARLTLFWDPATVAAADGNGSGGAGGNGHNPKAAPKSPSIVSNAVVEQTIEMCKIVNCVLSAAPEPTKYMCIIKPTPDGRTESLGGAIAKSSKFQNEP